MKKIGYAYNSIVDFLYYKISGSEKGFLIAPWAVGSYTWGSSRTDA
jgi:hypothetical protein